MEHLVTNAAVSLDSLQERRAFLRMHVQVDGPERLEFFPAVAEQVQPGLVYVYPRTIDCAHEKRVYRLLEQRSEALLATGQFALHGLELRDIDERRDALPCAREQCHICPEREQATVRRRKMVLVTVLQSRILTPLLVERNHPLKLRRVGNQFGPFLLADDVAARVAGQFFPPAVDLQNRAIVVQHPEGHACVLQYRPVALLRVRESLQCEKSLRLRYLP